MNLTQKILNAHLVSGKPAAGEEVSIRIDQTLTQDSTGTMAYLQFEAMGIGRVRTMKSVAYIDHNTLQTGFENADDHQYIQSVTKKHGIFCSKPGNGICHQVHLERFGVPGLTLLGSDSHTPTGGGIGMLAIGAGGLDVAVAMGGGAYYLTYPKVVGIRLSGSLPYGVAAKDHWQTPELAEIRFWSGLVRWGVLAFLAGTCRIGKYSSPKQPESADEAP